MYHAIFYALKLVLIGNRAEVNDTFGTLKTGISIRDHVQVKAKHAVPEIPLTRVHSRNLYAMSGGIRIN